MDISTSYFYINQNGECAFKPKPSGLKLAYWQNIDLHDVFKKLLNFPEKSLKEYDITQLKDLSRYIQGVYKKVAKSREPHYLAALCVKVHNFLAPYFRMKKIETYDYSRKNNLVDLRQRIIRMILGESYSSPCGQLKSLAFQIPLDAAQSKQIPSLISSLTLESLKPDDVQILLPLLLDHASTEDINAILRAAAPLSVIPSSLSRLQVIRLRVMHEATEEFQWPPFAKQFDQIGIEWKTFDIQQIKKLKGLSREEKDAALAYYIERHQILLTKVKEQLTDDEFLRLAPYLRYLDFRDFGNIPLAQKFLQNCPNLNILHITSDKILEGIKELPLCQELWCISGCDALSALPALPLCQKLYCRSCPLLSALPALPQCQELNCSFCPLLSALPALPLCRMLLCYSCPLLSALPALPLCQELECFSCPLLSALPALPQCQKLACDRCPLLSALPALPLCQVLDCSYCPLLALPALPLCQELRCSFCPLLSSLPALPLCQKLWCYSCPLLSSLPALHRCRELECYGCPLTELPELPWDAHVVSQEEHSRGLPFTSLDIPIEKFTTAPVSLLLQLGDHLLKNKPFPNIYYFEKGKRNEAIDAGGVRRDFVTKLCLNLFNELKLEDNFPMASDKEEKAYRSLGCLLALCYPINSVYKIGPLFAPEVYHCLLKPNPGTDEWFSDNYLTLINAKDDLTKLAYLVEPDASDITKYTQEYFDNPKNRANLNREILKRAKLDPRLKAISWMAQEMRKKIPDLSGNLQERIEGVLNPMALKRKLTWEGSTQKYLINWIDNHPDQLEKFVYAVTGLRTLCSENLKIQVLDLDKDFIPVAHTCWFSLELSANYVNQASFDKKIELFLENAQAGSGFTIA